jgi:hypothetical protein
LHAGEAEGAGRPSGRHPGSPQVPRGDANGPGC